MTADEPPKLADVQQRFMNAVSHGGGEAAMIHMFCDQMAIPYDKLTSEEFNVFMRIPGKSAHLKNSASKRGKSAAQRKK